MKLKKAILNLAVMAAMPAMAQNPFVQTWFTSDPAPMVHDGTMYVYTGHDEDNADFFWMQEWRVYSTQDMVNWQDHGSPLALESFSWADDRAWASQTIERDGMFYWYICAHSRLSRGMAIGVAVSDSPTGPFRDAIGKPLFENGSWDHIDPTVMIDDDGQAWLMWGNPRVYYLKLNKDMISYSGELGMLDMTEEGFGAPSMDKREKGKKYKDNYTEGPWLRKVDSSKFKVDPAKAYQLLYAAGGVPEHISYSTAPSPTGPWTYAGEIMPLCETKSFTNHCGVADYKGHSYFFYHTGKLPNGGGFGRSVAVEEFKYNADGSFPTIMPTDEGVKPVGKFCPYRKVEAETMAFSKGIKTEQNDEVGVYVTDIHNGDYIKLQNVAFANKYPRVFKARVASGLRGGQIEIRLDSVRGRCLGTVNVPGTGGWEKWQTITLDLDYSTLKEIDAPTRTLSGIALPETADLYFVFKGRKGPKLFNFDWWEMRGLEQVNMPLFQTKYTADPSPMVVGDTLFLYTSHDASPEDIPDPNEKSSAGFFMYDWLLWSTTDMVNWTEHGAVASLKEFSWRSRENGAWAIQTVERNGKYYLYAPLHGHGIGVLVADTPYGPFKDPLGKPLVWQQEHWDDIDPSVFIDDDGQAYMFWGNPQTYCVKLNEDMISTNGDIYVLNPKDGKMRPVKEEGAKINLRVPFGEKATWAVKHYQEGPWFYKRNGHYYMGFASTCCPEGLGYAMSDSPLGPWKEQNYLMAPTQRDRGNHPGIADFKGHSYLFGQDYDLMHLETFQHHERRSVNGTEITYNADGTIQTSPYWLDLAPMKQLHWLNPYNRVEAETMAWGFGLKSAKMGIENTGVVKDMPESTGKKNMYIFDINDDEYIRLRGVDFGSKGAKQFAIVAAAAAQAGCTITLRLDSKSGDAIGSVAIKSTGSVEKYKSFSTKVKGVTGVHDLYLCFSKASGDVRLDWWTFK
jgi:beta-xylosidase